MKYVVLAILALFMCTQIGWSYQPSQEFVSVAVEPGQTVWQLALALAVGTTVTLLVSALLLAGLMRWRGEHGHD